MSRFMISTDLDGTLLDHHTYSTEPASLLFPVLDSLQIPWVFNTSKTFTEAKTLASQLGNRHPFIIENGSAIYIPADTTLSFDDSYVNQDEYFVRVLGQERHRLIETAGAAQAEYKFRRFSELSTDDVCELTGLDAKSAKQAMQRSYTEPLVWLDSDEALESFRTEMAKLNLSAKRGGRFVHLMGLSDKASAQRILADLFQRNWHEPVKVIALGDGENDSQMLNEADIPVQIRSPSHSFPTLIPKTSPIQTESYGPAGWYEAILKILDKRFDLNALNRGPDNG